MAYGDISDIVNLGYIPESDLNKLNTQNAARIPALFETISDEFDAYMRPRYGVPFPSLTVPPAVKRAVVHMVVYDLYIMRGFPSITEGSRVADRIVESYNEAKKFREDVRDGRAQFAQSSDATPSLLEAGASKAISASPADFKNGGGYKKKWTGCC